MTDEIRVVEPLDLLARHRALLFQRGLAVERARMPSRATRSSGTRPAARSDATLSLSQENTMIHDM